MSSAKQSLFKELDLDEPQWDVFSMTYDALKARLAGTLDEYMAQEKLLLETQARLAEAVAALHEIAHAHDAEARRLRLMAADALIRHNTTDSEDAI